MLVSLSKRDGGNVMECTGSCNWHWKLSHLLSAQGTYMKICKHMQQWEQLLNARTAVGAWTSLFFWTLWDLCSILFPAQRLICWNCMCVSVSTQHTHKQYTHKTQTLTDSYHSYRLLPFEAEWLAETAARTSSLSPRNSWTVQIVIMIVDPTTYALREKRVSQSSNMKI